MSDSADDNLNYSHEQPVFDRLQELENTLRDLSIVNEYGETGLETTSLTIPEVLNMYSEVIKLVVHKEGESTLLKMRKQSILKSFYLSFSVLAAAINRHTLSEEYLVRNLGLINEIITGISELPLEIGILGDNEKLEHLSAFEGARHSIMAILALVVVRGLKMTPNEKIVPETVGEFFTIISSIFSKSRSLSMAGVDYDLGYTVFFYYHTVNNLLDFLKNRMKLSNLITKTGTEVLKDYCVILTKKINIGNPFYLVDLPEKEPLDTPETPDQVLDLAIDICEFLKSRKGLDEDDLSTLADLYYARGNMEKAEEYYIKVFEYYDNLAEIRSDSFGTSFRASAEFNYYTVVLKCIEMGLKINKSKYLDKARRYFNMIKAAPTTDPFLLKYSVRETDSRSGMTGMVNQMISASKMIIRAINHQLPDFETRFKEIDEMNSENKA